MLSSALRRPYNRYLRPHLPRKWAVFNGVPARDVALFDATDTFPDYKEGLVDAIHEHVSPGDSVTLVGAGRGVSTVHCLRAGADQVVAYEAAADMLPVFEETVACSDGLVSNPTERVDLRHAVVGRAIHVYGEMGDPEVVDPGDLDAGDVLVLDVEGAEVSILSGLTEPSPQAVVESHPRYVSTDETRQLLAEHGYEVDERAYEPGRPDKSVLVGVRPVDRRQRANAGPV